MKTSISRRDLLRCGAIAGAACVLPFNMPLAESQPLPSLPIRLGLASYTFRNFTRAQLVSFMRQLSLDALNTKDVKDHLPTDPQQQAQALADYAAAGIKLHAAGVITFSKDEDEDMRAKFEYGKRAAIPVIVASITAPAMLPRIEKFVRQYNIKIAFHNHGPEDKVFPSPLDVLKLIRDMDPRIGCCIDAGHTMRAKVDVVEAIHAVGPRLFNFHVKDLADTQSKESQVAVGEGRMPIRQIFQALIANGYKGFVDLEYEINPEDPMPGVIASFAYMRGVIAGMT